MKGREGKLKSMNDYERCSSVVEGRLAVDGTEGSQGPPRVVEGNRGPQREFVSGY